MFGLESLAEVQFVRDDLIQQSRLWGMVHNSVPSDSLWVTLYSPS